MPIAQHSAGGVENVYRIGSIAQPSRGARLDRLCASALGCCCCRKIGRGREGFQAEYPLFRIATLQVAGGVGESGK